MIDEIPIMIEKYADEFMGLMFLIIDLGIQLIMALIDGLILSIPKLIDMVPSMVDKLNGIVKSYTEKSECKTAE